MKIITWNVNRAAYTRKNLWDYLKKLDFDVGLFQEVYMIPNEMRNDFFVIRGEMNAILIKKNAGVAVKKEDILDINSENLLIKDFSVSCEMEFLGKQLRLINVYNYIGPKEKDFSEFLEILYRNIQNRKNKITIVGGDFNMNKKFQGYLAGWSNLAKNMIKKFSELGYREALCKKSEQDNFTFVTPNKKASYQLDYLFLPEYIKINKAMTEDKDKIFNRKPRLSDHLPIIVIAEIEI